MATKQATPTAHHMLRTLSFTGAPGPNGEQPVEQVDADVSGWLDKGYTLSKANYAGETPGGIRILYVFVKNGAG
jgi:hypothetical protein